MNPEVRFAGPIDDVDRTGRQLRVVATVLETPYEVFGPDGPFMETMASRVFEATLSRHSSSIPLLVNHDRTAPGVGRAESWANEGNRLIATYTLGDSDEARRVQQEIADGGFGGVSTSFIPRRSQWSKDRTAVRREEARLLELSLATIPANADHEILELRSLVTVAAPPPPAVVTPALDDARRRLERLRANAVISASPR